MHDPAEFLRRCLWATAFLVFAAILCYVAVVMTSARAAL